MRPAFPPERPDRSHEHGLFWLMDERGGGNITPGSFAECWFGNTEPVDPDEGDCPCYKGNEYGCRIHGPLAAKDDESEITISPNLTDAMIDEACERAEALLAEMNKAFEDHLDLDPGCTCTVVPYTGRLSERKPAEIEARFEKTHAEICDHCFSRLTA